VANDREDFYTQFKHIALQAHQDWVNSPEGTLAILRDPWKSQPPTVHVSPPGSANPKDILNMLRQRKAQQMAINPDYGNVV
jgi:hypothetical protein